MLLHFQMELSAKWQPFKDISDATEQVALNKASSLHPLKILLRKHKSDFLSLLKNQIRNEDDRATVKKRSGIPVQGNLKVIDDIFIEEVLILSDIFELNELVSFDLLLAGEQQKPNYTNYSRGLVAVLLYWDGKRNLASALQNLIQCRKGKSWTLELNEDTTNLATSFTDELLANGLTKQLLTLLQNINVEAELEKLTKQKGLGDASHRRQVRDLITEVRQCLADSLFYFAGQSDLPTSDVLSIIEYLRENSEVDGDGKLSSTTISVLFSLLYSISLPLEGLSDDDEEEERLKRFLICKEEFLLPIHKAISSDENTWTVSCVRALTRLAWSLTLRLLSQSPLSSSFSLPMNDVLEQDEVLLESALCDRVFSTVKENIVQTAHFHNEEFFLRRIHGIISDLIVNMPLKIKEMRSHGDEVARIIMLHIAEGEEVPQELRKDFQQLMELITAVYDKDPLNLELSAEYWWFVDQTLPHNPSFLTTRRLPHKQMALFKFVRLSGDILPPLLYIPYIRMLSALSTGSRSARAAFELLRSNGNNGDAMISWNHFFSSCHRYFENLRLNKRASDFTNPFAALQTPVATLIQPKVCTITPQEVEGLRSVMKLTAKIAHYDDIACLSFFEDSEWCVCGVLFGLLQCPVPVVLKGDILLVLCEEARLPGVGPMLLQASDQAQLLKKWPGVDKPGGVANELEAIESRDEEYPMTRGFVKLLAALAEQSVDSFGESFLYYLNFVVDFVFLRFMTRAYLRVEEKWEVATPCLHLFNKILMQYIPHHEEFNDEKSYSKTQDDVQSLTQKSINKHPGMPLLCHLYNDGKFFLTVMQVVSACANYLDSYVTKQELEQTLVPAALESLQLLVSGLEHQESFLEAIRSSGRPLFVTALDKVMLGVNPETGRADFVITLLRFVKHSSKHPHLSLYSITVLTWLCSLSTHRQVVNLMINSCDDKVGKDIIHGFVEILDTHSVESEPEVEQTLVSQQRESILHLLIHCIDHPAPNLSHILLGFDLNKPPSQSNLQDPGVLGSCRSCLHSILSILTTDGSEPPAAVLESPKLAELCYQLLYKLAFNIDSTEPVLRYLRSSYDFLYKHLQCVPFQRDAIGNVTLMQHSWLLKTAAIELHVLASKQQRTNAQRLIQVLFSRSTAPCETSSSFIGQTFIQPDRSRLGDVSVQSISLLNSNGKRSSPTKPAMLELFDIVDLHQKFPPPLILDQFVLSVVEESIRSCETKNEHGVVFCDIKVLHHVLEASLHSLASEDMTRKRLASQDIENILRMVVTRNEVRFSVHSKLHFLTSWKQLLEVVLTSCPDDVFLKTTRQQVVFAVLQHLVKAVHDVNAAQELTSSLAPIVLTLAMQIRSSVTDLNTDKFSEDDLPQDIMNTLSTFQVVIQGLIEWLLHSGIDQKARVSLYAALLHYLQLCKQTKKFSPDLENYTCLKSLHEGVYSRILRENSRLFRDFGDPFKNLLCKDAFNGHSICRVLAFGCLDSILQTDPEQAWLQYMLKNGYINHIANSFSEEDSSLQEYLNPSTRPPRSVYIFEQKMALLCSIAHTPGGARAIINSQIFPELAKCDFLEMRPAMEYSNDPSLPTALSRYRQLLFPVLQLCISLLNALGGSTHHEGCAIVLQFVLSHQQSIVMSVLRSNASDIQSLTELSLVSGILCQVAGQDFTDTASYPDIPHTVLMEIQASLLRIQRHLINILPTYLITDDILETLKEKSADQESCEKTILLLHEIASNLLTYCRVIVTQSTDADSKLLFSSELAETSFRSPAFGNELLRKPSMGVLVKFLQTALSRFNSEQENIKQLTYKFENIDKLTPQDLKEILGPKRDVVQLTVIQEQKLASTNLRNSINRKSKLTKCLLYILETALYLLWRHLNEYVNYAITSGKAKERLLYPVKSSFRNSPRRLQDISNISVDEKFTSTKEISPVNFDHLKSELQSSMPDSFLKKLSLVEGEGLFVQPLVRRIQSIKLQLN